MKKFIQYTAIIGAVLSVLGFGTAWAAKINGGDWRQEEIFNTSFTLFSGRHGHKKEDDAIVRDTTETTLQETMEEIEMEAEALGQDSMEAALEEAVEEIKMEAEAIRDGDTGQEKTEAGEITDGTPVLSFPAVKELELSIGSGEVEIVVGNVSGIQIFYNQETQKENWVKAKLDEDGEELDIQVKKPITSRAKTHPQVKIVVPVDYEFHSVDVFLAAGDFQASGLRARELDADVAAGNAEFWECGSVDVSFGCVTGNIVYSGTVSGDVDGECSMGNIQLSLDQKETDFNYELQGVGGTIRIGDLELGGLAFEREIFNNASREMELECTTGNIMVDFSV